VRRIISSFCCSASSGVNDGFLPCGFLPRGFLFIKYPFIRVIYKVFVKNKEKHL
jgi:hypothetical protein